MQNRNMLKTSCVLIIIIYSGIACGIWTKQSPYIYEGIEYFMEQKRNTYYKCMDINSLMRFEMIPQTQYQQIFENDHSFYYIKAPLKRDDGNYYFGESKTSLQQLNISETIPETIDCVKLNFFNGVVTLKFNQCNQHEECIHEKDIDECKSVVCNYDATCLNTYGGYLCGCQPQSVGPGMPCKPHCPPERRRDFTFQETLGDYISYSVELCPEEPNITIYPMVSRRCVIQYELFRQLKVAKYQSFLEIECGRDYGADSPHVHNVEELEITTGGLQIQSSPNDLLVEEIENFEKNVESLSEAITSNKLKISQDSAVYATSLASHLSKSLSRLNETSLRLINGTNSSLITFLDVFLNNVNQEERNTVFINSDFIILQILNNVSNDEDLTFLPEINYDENQFEIPVNLTLPEEIFSGFDKVPTTILALYRGSYLFNSTRKAEWVISATLGENNPVSNLTDPVVITFNNETRIVEKKKPRNLTAEFVDIRCAFWDYELDEWSIDGCCLDTNSTPATCRCNHLTNFAVLVSIDLLPADLDLSLFGQIGCGASILGYLAVIVIFVCDRKTLSKLPTKLQLHLFANLLAAYCIFVFGVDQIDNARSCMIITAALHYTLLNSWFWMAIYSYFLYSSLVSVTINIGRINSSSFLLKCCLTVYGASLIIVGGNFGVTVGYFDENLKNKALCNPEDDPLVRSYYLSDNVCWIRSYSLYLFLATIGIVIVYNTIVVIKVAVVFSSKPTIRSSAQKQSRYNQLKSLLKLSILLGLHWVVGFFFIISTDIQFNKILSWTFNSIAALQGVYTFIACCVLRQDILVTWFPTQWFTKKQKVIKLARGVVPKYSVTVSHPTNLKRMDDRDENVTGGSASTVTAQLENSDCDIKTSTDTIKQMKNVISQLSGEILSQLRPRDNQFVRK